jgi:hypothetical protein
MHDATHAAEKIFLLEVYETAARIAESGWRCV